MLTPFIIYKEKEALTDLQKQLDFFLREQYDKLDKELDTIKDSGDPEAFTQILHKMIEILDLQIQIGIAKNVGFNKYLRILLAENENRLDGMPRIHRQGFFHHLRFLFSKKQ